MGWSAKPMTKVIVGSNPTLNSKKKYYEKSKRLLLGKLIDYVKKQKQS
jgi:hypothetical protein